MLRASASCLVGPDVRTIGVDDALGRPLVVRVETTTRADASRGLLDPPHAKDRQPVELVDLPAFGRPTRLVWHKRR